MEKVLSEAEKDVLIQRYLDIKFIDDVSEFQCKRCDRVALIHYLSNCDHVFCRNCRDIINMPAKNKWHCPKCNTEINDLSKQSIVHERKINQISIHCLNTKYGCKVTAKIMEMPEHLGKCKDTREANLPKLWTGKPESECVQERLDSVVARVQKLERLLEVLEKDFATKMTNISDQSLLSHEQRMAELNNRMADLDSGLKDMRSDFETEKTKDLKAPKSEVTRADLMKTAERSKEDLLKNVVELENKIEQLDDKTNFRMDDLQKKQIRFQEEEKKMETRLKTMEDSFKNIKDQLKLQDEKQIQTKIEIDQILQMKGRLEALEKSMVEMKTNPTDNPQSTCEEVWSIDKFSQISNEVNHRFSSTTLKCDVQVFMKVPKTGPIILSLCFTNTHSTGNVNLPFGSLPSVTYEVSLPAITSALTRHCDSDFTNRLSRYDQRGYFVWLPPKDSEVIKRYLDRDTLRIKINLTSPTERPASTNGVIEWKIVDYAKKKQMEADELCPFQQSPVFYTGAGKYRVRARVWLNGLDDQKGQGISAIVVFLAGDNDNVLPKVFEHTRTFAILDQIDTNASGKVTSGTLGKMNTPRVHLGTHREVENGRYVKNDIMTIKVTIKSA